MRWRCGEVPILRAEAASEAEAVDTSLAVKSSAVTELSIAVSRKARARFTAALSSGRRGWPILRSQRAPQRVRQPCDDRREGKRIESAGARLERLGQHGGGSGSSATASTTNGVIAQTPSAKRTNIGTI
jgi:hypothetical protein